MHDNADYGKSASSDTLREQVAEALAAEFGFDEWDAGAYLVAADAAIGVVLSVVADEIKALRLPRNEMQPSGWNHGKRDVLALVTQLGEGVSDGE